MLLAQLQQALEPFFDFVIHALAASQELVQFEVGEAPIGHARRQQLAQAARRYCAKRSNLFVDYTGEIIAEPVLDELAA